MNKVIARACLQRGFSLLAAGTPVALLAGLAGCGTKVAVVVDGQVHPIHRYSFSGFGTTAVDSIGSADGQIVGAELTGQGSLTLAGGTGAEAQYVTLPHGLLRELRDATFEAWVTWAPSSAESAPWQRIFDFGEGATGIEGEQASGVDAQSYLFLTPLTVPRMASEVPYMRAALQVPHNPQSVTLETVVNTDPMGTGVQTHVGVVIDSSSHRMSLFVQGQIVGEVTLTEDDPLSYVYDINDWLGRSQFAADTGFVGTFNEFRIYSTALTASEIRVSYDSGPDVIW